MEINLLELLHEIMYFFLNLKIFHHERRISQLEALNEMPLYPTEEIIWDENVVPMEYSAGESKCSFFFGTQLCFRMN